jgi:protein-disulfide isomerase
MNAGRLERRPAFSLLEVPVLQFAGALLISASLLNPSAQDGRTVSVDDDPVLGDANAPVTIIEFSDYQCEFCRLFWRNTFGRLKREYIDTGKVKLVFRDFPQSIHPEAQAAALAAECADDQGKYWEYHDKVFSEQVSRGKDREVVRVRRDDLKKWAADIGLEAAEFNQCLDSRKHRKEVDADRDAGEAAGVKGTPVFFINGRPLVGAYPFDAFQKIIDEELQKSARGGGR